MSNPYQWLAGHAQNVTSQFGENGILDAIFGRIGTTNRWCVDVGAADGILFSNVRPLIERGWNAVLFEADESRFRQLSANNQGFIEFPKDGQIVRLGNYRVNTQGVTRLDALLARFEVPKEFDLLSIDVDGQDWYILNSMLEFTPRVVVIEYDPNVPEDFLPAENGEGQAGLRAIQYIAASKGYLPVGRTATNLILVRRDLAGLLETEGAADPTGKDQEIKIKAVMSVPRYGSMATRGIIDGALRPFGIPLETSQGVFWDQCLQKHFEDAKAQGVDWILTIDFDSTFTADQLDKMFHLFGSHPEIDALVALQARRGKDFPLCTIKGTTDQEITGAPFQVTTAHFGLSLFRVDALARMPKPWFFGIPNIYGVWGEGKNAEDDAPIPWLEEAWKAIGLPDSDPTAEMDADIWFWHQWRRAGNTVFVTPEVRIGHGEELVRVFDEHMNARIQTVTEWRDENFTTGTHRTKKVGA